MNSKIKKPSRRDFIRMLGICTAAALASRTTPDALALEDKEAVKIIYGNEIGIGSPPGFKVNIDTTGQDKETQKTLQDFVDNELSAWAN